MYRKFVSPALLALSLFIVAQAFGATVEVSPNISSPCQSGFITFATIQQAVNAVPAGSTIMICPATYPEQVTISKAVTLRGLTVNNASGPVIVPPTSGMVQNATSFFGTPIAAQIFAGNANQVNIQNVALDGSANQIAGCAPELVGIFYQNASGTILRSSVLNEVLGAGLEGCQSGLGIFVQSGGSPAGTSTVTVSNSLVQGYTKNGITANEAGTSATITGNSVTGLGPTTGAAENGIQLGFEATGSVSSNIVSDHVWIGDPSVAAAAGILIYASPNVTINANSVQNSQFSITVDSGGSDGSADGSTITSNKVSTSHIWDGIDVCSNNNTVRGNTINGSDEAAIRLDSFCTEPDSSTTGNGNSVTSNIINTACSGILANSGTSGNSITPNQYFNTTTNVLNADECTTPLRPSRHHGRSTKPFRP